MSGTLGLSSGTVSAPGLYGTGDTNTGIYFPGADQMAVTIGGTQKILLAATGINLVPSTTNAVNFSSAGIRAGTGHSFGWSDASSGGGGSWAAYFSQATANIITCHTSAAERFRVDASGLINIGQTSLTAQLGVQTGSSTRIALLVKAAASQTADVIALHNSGGGYRFGVSAVGNVGLMGSATSSTVGLRMGGGGERIDTTGTAYGIDVTLANSLQGNSIGMSFIVESRCPSATGTVGTMIGVQGGIYLNSATAITTAFYGFYVVDPNITAGAAVGTIYGLLVKPQKVTGVTTAYGLYMAGTADLNYIANSLSLGNIAASMPAGLTGPALVLGNCTAAPTGNPTSGGTLYSEAGALKWRGSSGTVTTLAVA